MYQLAVIGDPISHSLSPLMHSAAIEVLKINYSYTALNIKPHELKSFVQQLTKNNWKGINVTIPHKQTIIPYLDTLDPSAQRANAVNTVVVKNDKLIGYNTDGYGFLQGFKHHNINIRDKHILLLGAGGAGYGIAASLLQSPIKSMTISNRNVKKATQLCQSLKLMNSTPITTIEWNETNLINAAKNNDIIINTTPIGMINMTSQPLFDDYSWVNNEKVCYDIIYNPLMTPFLRNSAAKNATVINGLDMFVGQGAKAFELFTDIEPSHDVMKRAVLNTYST